jgi:uncharacterized membrane protein YjfL (UPF0719 family)
VLENESIKTKPNYDINHFKGRVESNISILGTKTLTKINSKLKKNIKPSTIWMWAAIGIVALLLGYMSYKMITEMEKNE